MRIGHRLVVNAGSVGLPAYEDDEPPHRMETFNPMAKFVVVEGDLVTVQHVPYDHEASAQRARKNGRADWADWISRGRCR